MPLFLPGYSGTIWNAIRATISYVRNHLDVTNQMGAKTLAHAAATTLKNGVAALNVGVESTGLQLLFANLNPVTVLPIALTAPQTTFMLARVAAIQAAAVSIAGILVQPLIVDQQLSRNLPAIPDPRYLEWQISHNFETPPAGLTAANFADQAQAEADTWVAVDLALRQQGVPFTGAMLNIVQLMGRAAQIVADEVAHLSVSSTLFSGLVTDEFGNVVTDEDGNPIATISQAGTNADVTLTSLWNQCVAMPTITRVVAAMMNDPTSATAQNTAVARYVALNTLRQFNRVITSLRDTITIEFKLGTVRSGDSLMTFASRELNDYTLWRAIAQINGLQPPYIASAPAPGLASPGQQLFLPTGQVAATPQTAPVSSYVNNYLGIDRFLGPINKDMLAWVGDYSTIGGYRNLSMSLGRRLQTTIGNLIYHNLYGSRIPPEVGAIATNDTYELLAEYAKSALLSDPRVNQIISCTVQLLGNYSIVVNSVVLPNGLGQEEVTVNEVIGPP